MRVLDLGCGPGQNLDAWGITPSSRIVGVDIDSECLSIAKTRFPDRTFLRAAGERLPFKNGTFDHVLSAVALPYMDIPAALAEIYRVLVMNGRLSLSLHTPGFTTQELLHNAIPKPVPTLFRLYVMANGLFFHCTGNTLRFVNRRTESFQTQRGIGIALHRAGFDEFSFRRSIGPAGDIFVVQARKAPPHATS